MSGKQYYQGAIWTNHALERLGQRGLSQDMATKAFRSPDKSSHGKQRGTMEYQKQFGPSTVTIIAKQNDKREWIILSCWIDPPLPGSIDIKKKQEYLKYQKASFWGKFWINLRRQLLGF